MKNLDETTLAGCLYISAILFFLSLYPVFWVTKSYFEAASYNRVTNSNVSTWDAMWIELRVQSEPK